MTGADAFIEFELIRQIGHYVNKLKTEADDSSVIGYFVRANVPGSDQETDKICDFIVTFG